MQTPSQKYIIAFFITATIFFTAFYISNSLNQKRIDALRTIESKIAIDILSSETQFNLLSESSCSDFAGQTVLSAEINTLGQNLSFTEERLGSDDPEVIDLKKYYSLLQIKDYLLMKKISERCGIKPMTILYFYSNEDTCEKCREASYVLSSLRDDFPEIRVYSFDYNLNLSAIKTLISILKLEPKFPAIVYKDKSFYEISNIEEFEKAIPELKTMHEEKEKKEALNASSTDKK